MKHRIAAFDFITRSLACDSDPREIGELRRCAGSDNVDWGLVVAMANQYLVTPALWVGLRDKGLVELLPKDLREYLEVFHSFNEDRNLHLKNMTVEAVRGLNAQDIEPVLLKGAAHLFTNTFGDMGARMMGDVDILVPKDKFDVCLEVFSSLHFRSAEGMEEKFAGHHHHAPLFRPGDYATIELHRDILPPAFFDRLPTDMAWNRSRLCEAEDLRAKVLSPTHRVLHNILHAEIVDRNHRKGIVCLRQIHDLVATCALYGREIDWSVIRERMSGHGEEKILEDYLYLAHRLFGMALPAQIRFGFGNFMHYARCRLKIRYPQCDRLLRRFSARKISELYGCERTFPALTIGRIRLAFSLLKKYAGRSSL